MSAFDAAISTLDTLQPVQVAGSVASVRGLAVMVDHLRLPVGSLVRFTSSEEDRRPARCGPDPTAAVRGEVVGFEGGRSIVMLLTRHEGVAPGMRVIGECASGRGERVGVGEWMLGRVIDGFGAPIDQGGPPGLSQAVRVYPASPEALRRARITEPIPTGVRSIDGFLTVGRGQRVGILSAAGVGKSTLLGSIARNAASDVNVIALIGERGREVREFIEESLSEAGLERSVVVVATADESPLLRVRAAFVACAVAEYFRDRGRHVMLMMDSITRFAQGQRQIGLAVGEPPATRGYTPSVFARLGRPDRAGRRG